MTKAITFVYNADSGGWNALRDLVHKTLAPGSYPCSLCQITYAPLGMRKSWKKFLEELAQQGFEIEFLHRDELEHPPRAPLPAVFLGPPEDARVLLAAAEIDACADHVALRRALREALAAQPSD